ncbi:HU family DNA-binding protein [Parabacteroides sp. PF5-9]|uniref:HU family DNA-binding protein n=1 Tax=Parabacteroides sp. PF5-9 TaxID=1742404 RepID=UPI002475A92A|nr:HU family DNA-binding protein [Parabacteroides sp. PF5-9]MDH6359052.1 putative histone-like DNA-binding protein [Parabacteroides sp. PF5-9]
MSLKFTLHKTPVPKNREKEKLQHARIVSNGTMDMEKMCKLVSAGSSFSSADVKGILEAFTHWMSIYLSDGTHIHLEGIGHFFPTLRSSYLDVENGEKALSIAIDTVGFRCSSRLKKQLRQATLERIIPPKGKRMSQEERQENILSYLLKNEYISCTGAMGLNHCTRYTALDDLKTLIAAGRIRCVGRTRQTVYIMRN